uniref:Uncharacterized protein n=1 Tax=Tetranychus urticae TaxID=32264 RepID=T1L0Y3_TETUR
MLIYLSKKIAVPNQRKVRSIAWSQEHGFIACGAGNGLLKVLKLDTWEVKSSNLNLPKNLSMNQTLEGHNGDVISIVWNERYEKLTSSDSNGLIIVWMLYKGSWYEEMVNNRNRSVVIGMCWSSDGLKICIVYEDGAVIVGSVDGNRLWGKEIKSIKLTCVQWSPDGRLILFGSTTSQAHIYDQIGNYVGKVPLPGVNGAHGRSITGFVDSIQVVDIKWFSNGNIANSLAIGLSNGVIQLMKNECDDNPLLIDTKMTITSLSWNYFGTYLAVTGKSGTTDESTTNWVKFYDPIGTLVQSLKVPGKDIVSCAWEKEGLRIALGVDYYIFFANIRPDYLWSYFANTMIVALPRDMKTLDSSSGPNDTVIFYNFNSNSRQIKNIKNLKCLAAYGQYCVFATGFDDTESSSPLHRKLRSASSSIQGNKLNFNGQSDELLLSPTSLNQSSSLANVNHTSLVLCNSIGAPIDSVNIDLAVNFIAINSTRVIAASTDTFVVWSFKVPSRGHNNDNSGHVSSLANPFGTSSLSSLSSSWNYNQSLMDGGSSSGFDDRDEDRSNQKFVKIDTIHLNLTGSDEEQIVCITLSERSLVLATDNGNIFIYLLPELSLSQKFSIDCKPKSIYLNCDSSRLAIIDSFSLLTIIDLDATTTKASILDFEKKDVWDFCWSTENSDAFAITEKSKLIVYSNLEADESITSNGNIVEFKDLVVKMVLIDGLVIESCSTSSRTNQDLTSKSSDSYLVEHETKLLREAKEILKKVGPVEGTSFIEEHSHPKLWRLLSESSLESLDFKNAELALVRCKDHKGIQFAKRVSKLPSQDLQRAEVYAFFGLFDEAEKVYLNCDRQDLAISLRKMIGDWSRVVKLIESDQIGPGSNDAEMREALKNLGDYCYDSHLWSDAAGYYEQCSDWFQLFKCFTLMENYDGLRRLSNDIESPSLLEQLGWIFESSGLCSDAVKAYQKASRLDSALKCCVNLNEWRMAITLAEERQITDIDALMTQYANHLLSKERYIDIVELYRKANRIDDACEMLIKIIDKVKSSSLNLPIINMKKAYTLIGLLYEQYHSATTANDRRVNTLNALLIDDHLATVDLRNNNLNKAFDQPWKGAEAYHFYISAQRQLYAGYYDSAMKTSLNLIDYDDFIDPEDIYSLIAITSITNSNYYIASKAFIKLESLESIPEERRLSYQDLAISIFTVNQPKESKNLTRSECTYCETMIADWSTICPSCNVKFPICVASGKPIMDANQQWTSVMFEDRFKLSHILNQYLYT